MKKMCSDNTTRNNTQSDNNYKQSKTYQILDIRYQILDISIQISVDIGDIRYW